jgi:hypothetical protein
MSYDLKIQIKCDHKINWERVELEDDRRTINTTYPVASEASLSVRINNVVVPGTEYGLSLRREPLSLRQISYIYMGSKVRHFEPLVELRYTTYPEYCPKCLAVKTIDDIKIGSNGDFAVVQKERLLMQAVEKSIVTQIQSNPFHDWYGTGLHNLVGTKVTDIDFLRKKIVDQVTGAIDKLKNVQTQLVAGEREVDAGELYGRTISIDIQRTEDPSTIEVVVVFTSQGGNTLEYTQFLELSQIRERVAFP